VFWNAADDAPRFLSALEAARKRLPFSLEVIAVDNNSSDGTAELVARDFPWVTLVRNADNEGFAAGCNTGIAHSIGSYVLLLNPDCEANAEALAGMVRLLERNPRVGAVGCALLHGDGLPQHSAHGEPGPLTYWASHSLASPIALRVGKLLHRIAGGNGCARQVAWLMGACIMVPRAVIEKVGPLDPEYFMYSEDADWCRRIREAGYKVVFTPRWAIIHHHGTSARRRPEFTFLRLYRSLLLYVQKHQHGADAFLTRAAVATDMALRLPIYAVTGNRARLKSARTVLMNYVRGHWE